MFSCLKMLSCKRELPILLWYLGLFLFLPSGGRSCSTTSTSTPECEIQPQQTCNIIGYYTADEIASNYTIWICTDNGVTSMRCTPNCCSYDNLIEAAVNITLGSKTTIECSIVSSNPISSNIVHDMKINAPPGSRVLLTVPNYDVHNTITVTDEDSGNTYFFNPENYVTGDDHFLSSSNTIYVRAIFTNAAQTGDISIIAKAFKIIDTINVTSVPQQCAVSPPASGGNQWHTGTECENDMYNFNGSCYQINTANMDFETALTICEARGSHLVYIESSEEQDFLVDAIVRDSPQNKEYWIGVDRNPQGERVWMDGTAITYSNFVSMSGIPRMPVPECFQMREQEAYMWASHECHGHAYICEREQAADCGAGTYNFNGSCYQINTAKMDPQRARTECERSGSHLVYINSIEEQEFLESTINGITTNEREYWIGIERNAQGRLVWMDGSAITYSNFVSMGGTRECYQMREQEEYMWEDHDCNHGHAYICERERGYIGYSPNHAGCIAFSGTLPTIMNVEGSFLLKFSYIIKYHQVIQNPGRTRITAKWTGNYVIDCRPGYIQFVNRNGLQVEASCIASLRSPGSWLVSFHARGTGVVQIGNMQLLSYEETEPPTSGPTSPIQTTDPDASLTTAQIQTVSHSTSPTTLHLTTITTDYTKIPGGLPSGLNNAVISTIAVLLLFIVVVVIMGIICFFRRRRISAASLNNHEPKPKCSGKCVENPTFDEGNNEQHEYTEFNDAVNISAMSKDSEEPQDIEQHEYSELPSSDPTTKHDNLGIYNEVGEEDYNVLFGGKEKGDYHEYSLPETNQGEPEVTVSGEGYSPQSTDHSYQDLQKLDDKSYTRLDHLHVGAKSDHVTKTSTGQPYDVLERGTKLTEPSSSCIYNSLRTTDKSTEGLGSQDGTDRTLLDFSKSTLSNNEAYDHLQDRSISGALNTYVPPTNQACGEDADGYEIPNGPDTYHTLDKLETPEDGEDNEEYSQLKRHIDTGTPTDQFYPLTEYGKLDNSS